MTDQTKNIITKETSVIWTITITNDTIAIFVLLLYFTLFFTAIYIFLGL
jgi:hypothetical protein